MEFLVRWISNASVLAILIVLPTFLLPPQFYQFLKRFFLRLFFAAADSSQSIITITISEFDAYNNNELFLSVHAYLSNCFPSSPNVKLSKPKNSNTLTFTIDSDQVMEDTFDGMRMKWLLRITEKKCKIFGHVYRCRKFRSFELSFHNKHTTKVQSCYLPHVMQEAASINGMNMNGRQRNQPCRWVVGLVNVIGSLVIQLMGSW